MRSVYLQLWLVLAASLVVFGTLVGFFWIQLEEKAALGIADKTTRVVKLLVPPQSASPQEQQRGLNELTEALDVDLMLLSANGEKLAGTGTHSPLPTGDLAEGEWTVISYEAQWATQLDDGRYLSVVPHDLLIVDRTLSIGGLISLLALVVGLAAYPFIRRLTRRLKRLQTQVERVGSGDLEARVDVDGRDEISQLAQSFNTSASRIEALVRSQRMLFAHTSHELRTPLARIRMGIELLNTSDEDAQQLDELRQDITELDALIDELLLMSRLAGGLDERSVQDIDVVALVAEESARYPSCSVAASEPVFVSGEPAALRRVFRNLLENAFRHGEEPVAVSIARDVEEVVVTVSDSGSGIPEEEREQVWQPFRRTEASASRPGYGLGLALVQRTAEAHRGSVEMRSGDKFDIIVKLPVVTPDAEKSA